MTATFREMLKTILPEFKSMDKFTVAYYQEQMDKHRSKQAKIKSLCRTALDQLLLWGIYGQYDNRKLQQSELNTAVCIFKKYLSDTSYDIDHAVNAAIIKIACRAHNKYEVYCIPEHTHTTRDTVSKVLKQGAIKLFRKRA